MAGKIRLATPNDAQAVLDIYGPIVLQTNISFELEPPTTEEMEQRIAHTIAQFPWLVYEDAQGAVRGYVYATKHRARAAYQWSVEVSAYVSPIARRMGIGRSLYQSLFAILILQGYYNAYAGIVLPNPASVGLHEALGFCPIGVYPSVGYKSGAWHDVGWWQKRLQETGEPPTAPVSLPEAQSLPTWDLAIHTGLV